MMRLSGVAVLLTLAIGCGGSHTVTPARITSPPSAVTTSPTTVRAVPPLLGQPWGGGARYQKGFGDVRPATIFLGGDETGLVQHVHWRSWGGSRAVGSGIGEWLGRNQFSYEASPAAVTIVAFNLGECRGKRAYTAIAWYFPEHGQHFEPSTHIDICTGEYVGNNGADPPSA
jgi:hypothetical protein